MIPAPPTLELLPKTSRAYRRLKNDLNILDLFAGAGGLSEGFIAAGCNIVSHIEMDKEACETIRTRMIYHSLLKKGKISEYKKYMLGLIDRDLLIKRNSLEKDYDSVIQAEISSKNCQQLIALVRKRLGGNSLDMIIGGPPCQAYSHIGRALDKNKMKRDPRKFLYRYYVDFLKEFQPKLFVFENVPGLLSAGKGSYLRNMRRLMKKAGYITDYKVLNAADFGIPQNRKRVILIGWRADMRLKEYPEFLPIKRAYGVSDFLSDLPNLKAGEGVNAVPFHSDSKLLKKLSISNKQLPVLLDHVARAQSSRDLEIYKIAVQKKNAGSRLRYSELPQRLKTHKNETAFPDRFKVVNEKDQDSHTIIAHISKDGHYYIHPDIKQNRALTVREAARIQTFPDDFIFEGTRSDKFRQIGNAVPPMLSRLIANVLIPILQ